jgi:serine/threonine-protein kinase
MGVVWAATNTTTKRRVAIKLLKGDRADDPQVRRRFLREARAASAVEHPNVVQILDVFETDGSSPAMVMELLEGETLGQKLRRERKLSLPEAAAVIVPAVAAVGTAHAHGVVHRDLKPDNVFLAKGIEDTLVVKVLDFGIAKITAEGEGAQTEGGLTGTGAMLGTPYYMAPEQLFTDETIDYRCDVWALGVILYECLSGARPTKGDNFADIVKVIATRSIAPLRVPELPPEVSDLVMRMLSFEKEKRPQSLREVRDTLKHYTDVLATSFGEPVLTPIKQNRPDSSGRVGGLQKSDVDLLASTDPASRRIATTLDAPRMANTSDGANLGITLVGNTSRPKRMLAFGIAASAIAISAGAYVSVRASETKPAAASAAVPQTATAAATATQIAPAPPPPPAATEVVAPPPTVPVVESASRPPPLVTAKPPVQKPAPPPTTTTTTTTTSKPVTTAPGGLVEKPPF